MPASALEKSRAREVWERDEGLCVECGRVGATVHHILPRSKLPGRRNRETLHSARNMAVVCLWHHGPEAHTRKGRLRLLRIMAEKYGYVYEGWPWSEV